MVLKDLETISGLPIKLRGNKLVFGKGVEEVVPDVRTNHQMKPVLKNKKARAPREFYYMYRDVAMGKDRGKIAANGLRFDITVLPPFNVGDEPNKTFGHFHPTPKGRACSWPEVYEVLSGHAHYLLQSKGEFLVFDARPGDKCLMLPGFGHITVNPSSQEPLVMANWVYPGFKSDYGPIEKNKGACWFETTKGFVKNPAYKKVLAIQLIAVREFPEFGLTEKPMYSAGVKNPRRFEWLVKPWKYLSAFKEYKK